MSTTKKPAKEPKPRATGVEARVCQDIADRQKLGIAKYGTTVERNPLTLLAWMRHAYTEMLDGAVYLRRSIEVLELQEEIEREERRQKMNGWKGGAR